MIKAVKKDERIKELEAEQFRYAKKVLDLHVEIANQNCNIKNLKTALEQEQKKYTELLERYIAMMERVANIDGDGIKKPIEDLANKEPECDPKKYFSPEDVRKMSPGEVRQNYTAIINSMSKWRIMRYETDQET